MIDLLTPEMPADLANKLRDARNDLLAAAGAVDSFLVGFFPETWAECHRTFTVEHQGKTSEVAGTPDFNEFDRKAQPFSKAVSKLRWLLWDIDKAAKSHGSSSPAEAE